MTEDNAIVTATPKTLDNANEFHAFENPSMPGAEITPVMPTVTPIVQCKLVSKAQLKKMVKSHGFQLGSDFYHALNDRATRLVLDAMYRMMEKGWRVRVGVQDL